MWSLTVHVLFFVVLCKNFRNLDVPMPHLCTRDVKPLCERACQGTLGCSRLVKGAEGTVSAYYTLTMTVTLSRFVHAADTIPIISECLCTTWSEGTHRLVLDRKIKRTVIPDIGRAGIWRSCPFRCCFRGAWVFLR